MTRYLRKPNYFEEMLIEDTTTTDEIETFFGKFPGNMGNGYTAEVVESPDSPTKTFLIVYQLDMTGEIVHRVSVGQWLMMERTHLGGEVQSIGITNLSSSLATDNDFMVG